MFDAGENVLERMAAGETVEPAAHGKICHRHVRCTERLHRGGGNPDVPKKCDVREVVDPYFLDEFFLLLYLQDLAAAPDEKAGSGEVERAGVVAGGDETAGSGRSRGFEIGGEHPRFIGQANRD